VNVARKVVLFSLFLAAWGPATPSEAPTRLDGVVLDQAGSVVSGASVKLFSLEKVRETKTDNMGRFEFADLTPGSYDLQVERPGFKTRNVESIQITDKAIQQLSFTLQVDNPTCEFRPTISFESFEERSGEANLRGSVNDFSDGPLKNVRVTLTSSESGQIHVTTSNDKGAFQFVGLEPGKYALRFAHGGYSEGSLVGVRIARENLTNLGPMYMFRKNWHGVILCQ